MQRILANGVIARSESLMPCGTRSMQKSAAEIMKEQEALLMAKYGGASKFPMGKKKPGAPKVSEWARC